MKKLVEVMGTVDKQGQLFLDNPLSVQEYTRVKVIVLVSEKEEDELTESATDSFVQGWDDAMRGKTFPISQLWEGIDAE
ncbi:MAG: hypothetical protein QNJ55_08610 [Xenococcus sp. MO_188.B8]|nr:hypothetical protein [Xenococcus sp. MO_188.B8]